jgi:hypothetical protein
MDVIKSSGGFPDEELDLARSLDAFARPDAAAWKPALSVVDSSLNAISVGA